MNLVLLEFAGKLVLIFLLMQLLFWSLRKLAEKISNFYLARCSVSGTQSSLVYLGRVFLLALVNLRQWPDSLQQRMSAKITVWPAPQQRQLLLLGLAISDLSVIFMSLVILICSYQLAWGGFLTGPYALLDQQGEPAAMVLWLLDPTFIHLLILFLVGIFWRYLVPGFGFTILLSTALVFPFMISAPAACVLIFGEITGSWIRCKKLFSSKEIMLRSISTALSFLAFWALGHEFRQLSHDLDLNNLLPWDRMAEMTYFLLILLAADTLFSMLIFHFYFHWTKGEAE